VIAQKFLIVKANAYRVPNSFLEGNDSFLSIKNIPFTYLNTNTASPGQSYRKVLQIKFIEEFALQQKH
jgi:hypothetical protein